MYQISFERAERYFEVKEIKKFLQLSSNMNSIKFYGIAFVVLAVVAELFALPLDDNQALNPKLKSNDEYIEEQSENDIEASELQELQSMDEKDLIDLSHLNLKIFGQPDNDTTKMRLDSFDSNGNVNPEELGTYLEGDMLIPPNPSRNGMLSGIYRWPKGIVPYDIKGSFTSTELAYISQGINEYHTKTCIVFKPRTNERDYISIVNAPTGCWASIGRVGGRQEVNVQTPGCLVRGPGTFVHELMHSLGFLHEQNRHERDHYITVQYENINKDALHNFDKASPLTTHAFGVPYDYASVMHYSAYAFSTNGKPTILPKQKTKTMGQRNGFSAGDIAKINGMYRCTRKNG